MNQLEERYRRILRLLPAGYRREWEEDMVAAFLDSMDNGDPEAAAYAADFGRPSLPEVASVVSLAVRLRLGGVDAAPRRSARGQAVRLAVLMLMLANAVLSTAGLAFALWMSGKLGWLPAPPPDLPETRPTTIWLGAWGLLGSAWLPAYVALVLGHRRVAQALALLAVVPPAVGAVVEQVTSDAPVPALSWTLLLVDILLALALVAFRDGAPPVRRRPWLLAVPVGAVLVPVPLLVIQASNAEARVLDLPGMYCVVLTVAIAVHLIRWGFRRSSRSLPDPLPGLLPAPLPGRLPWSLALLLLAATALVLRLSTLAGYAAQEQGRVLTTIGLAQAAALLAVSLVLGVPTVRAWRRVPACPGARSRGRPASGVTP